MLSTASTAVLYADYTTRLSYYDDWLDAFESSRDFDVTAVNICDFNAAQQVCDAARYADVIILLHSTNGDTTLYLEPFVGTLADRRGRLVAFIGNEVNLPGSPLSAKREVLKQIGPDYIATQLPLEAGEYLWGDIAGIGVLALPHALNPAAFRIDVPQDARVIDVGVRAVKYIAHLGDDDRNRLHAFFAAHEFARDLRVDISEQRFDRVGWAGFLNQCKGTVSSEAGSWYLERDDVTVEAIRRWAMQRYRGRAIIANDSQLRRFGHKLPWWFRVAARKVLSRGLVRHEAAINDELDFLEVYNRFFKGREPPAVYGKCISSRHFDAIGTGTCQILIEGRYNDILLPDRHYISLRSDFSNIHEVITRFLDPSERQKIAYSAREFVLERHTYAHRIAKLHNILSNA